MPAQDLGTESMKAQVKPVKKRHRPVTFASLGQSVTKMQRTFGVCATSTVLKPTSILFVLPMGNLMIMHVKSKRHHARNRRKLKSCLWVDVKIILQQLQNLKMGITHGQIMQRMPTNWKRAHEGSTSPVQSITMASACTANVSTPPTCWSRPADVMPAILDNTVKKRTTAFYMWFQVRYDFSMC